MDDPRYNQEDEYDNYYEDDYRHAGVTSVGLPASQLALIIGANAVISLIISISVVLIAGRPAAPSEGAEGAIQLEGTSAVDVELDATDALVSSESLNASQEQIPAQSTPIETVTYVVESGDTLSLIAEKFSVSMFDLMVANGLTDEDFIQSGQSLVIPIGGVPTATATFTPVPFPTETPLPFDPPTPVPTDVPIPQEPAATVGPSPTPSNTPTLTPTPIPTSTPPPFDEIKVVVSEVIAPGDLFRETVVILNQGAGTSLNSWKLEGSPLAIFEFPDVFLFSGGSIRVHTAAGENTASDLYLSQGEAAWEPGGTIILSDDKNIEISRFTIPAATTEP